jgi:soluble lytic murein transglycosylase-like protein
MLAFLLLQTSSFESIVDRAFVHIRNNDWAAAASQLDVAKDTDSSLFAANNFHFLRGRIAENQRDWQRALEEFKQIQSYNPLYTISAWHAARAAARLGNESETEDFFAVLPRAFPNDLKLQLAKASSNSVALKIYATIATREARFEQARLTGDEQALRTLIRQLKDDDIALQAARMLEPKATSTQERLNIAAVYTAHRQFDHALPLYRQASESAAFEAESRFQIARIHFLRENYPLAIDTYKAIARDFRGTEWQKDAEYQIASCYWRLGDLRASEKAYLDYINKYRVRADEGATRNLVDVYRALGETQKAVVWLDKALAGRTTVTSRQVLLFTKAKVLFTQQKYTAAQRIFQQLSRTRIRPAAGGTTVEESQYFDALSLARSGRATAAKAIWKKLARDPLSYYGRRAQQQLGENTELKSPVICSPPDDVAVMTIEADLETLRHPLRMELDPTATAVSELLYLRLWDEASVWMEQQPGPTDHRLRAKVAYLGGRYNRAIASADRLPKAESSRMPLLYPAGYRKTVCDAAAAHSVDPLWLHAIIWQESRYNPNARSGAAARGLMQFIPETAEEVGTALGLSEFSVEQLYDPAVNIRMGAHLWSSLMSKLKYPEMALAAYNGGPTNVERWKNKGMRSADDLDMFVADIGFTETKRYVMAVFAARAAYGMRD